MSVNFAIDPRTARGTRRGPAEKLRDALDALATSKAIVLRHSEQAWASITFSGARHSVVLAFEGIDAAKAGEIFIAELPDHEFAIPGQLVADAVILSVDHTMLPDVRLVVKAELLLLQDA